VGEAGIGFESAEEIPALLERIAEEVEIYRGKIRGPRIDEVAYRYLKVLGLTYEVTL